LLAAIFWCAEGLVAGAKGAQRQSQVDRNIPEKAPFSLEMQGQPSPVMNGYFGLLMAWNLLSSRAKSRSQDQPYRSQLLRCFVCRPALCTPILYLAIFLGDSHGKDGRRCIENGEGKRSQVCRLPFH
jgi:hypothetical protein